VRGAEDRSGAFLVVDEDGLHARRPDFADIGLGQHKFCAPEGVEEPKAFESDQIHSSFNLIDGNPALHDTSPRDLPRARLNSG
jgi:hypothetical protein